MPASDVLGNTGSRRAYFANGALYQNPTSKNVFMLWGAIADSYLALGEAASTCGYPTSDVVATETGRAATFDGGLIQWVRGTGVTVDCS
jgi:hypothetical protein